MSERKRIGLTLIAAGGILAILGGGIYYWKIQQPVPEPDQSYENPAYGIAFSYPAGYVLSEQEVGTGARGHYAITLVREEDAVPVENGEGPTSITVDIYQNNIDQMNLIEAVSGTNIANFKLGDGTFREITIDGERALQNAWSGLYEGKTTTFLHEGSIIAITATYLTPEDVILADYERVLASVSLSPLAGISAEAAIAAAQGTSPELSSYPSDNLPPKRIETAPSPNGWFVTFATYGSGRAGILAAECFEVTNAREVRKTGSFSAGGLAAPEAIDPVICQPPSGSTQGAPSAPLAGSVTLRGEVVCLPHRDTSGPQTMECAFGLKAADGYYYGLQTADSVASLMETGTRVEVRGTMTPATGSEKYAIRGTLSVVTAQRL